MRLTLPEPPADPTPAESAPSDAPPPDCQLCSRLAAFRAANRAAYPTFFNAPVPSFGPADARLRVVGMAPGLKGANRTGRPFTGDHAGMLLFETLLAFGFAEGRYGAEPDDGLRLRDCRIVNAVRCVPPANLPEPREVATCNRFLVPELLAPGMGQVGVTHAILALGVLAHSAVLKALGIRQSAYKFAHGALHVLAPGHVLADSYHVSRYNTSTRKLTPEMFRAVIANLRQHVQSS